jgi:hypothetical protein
MARVPPGLTFEADRTTGRIVVVDVGTGESRTVLIGPDADVNDIDLGIRLVGWTPSGDLLMQRRAGTGDVALEILLVPLDGGTPRPFALASIGPTSPRDTSRWPRRGTVVARRPDDGARPGEPGRGDVRHRASTGRHASGDDVAMNNSRLMNSAREPISAESAALSPAQAASAHASGTSMAIAVSSTTAGNSTAVLMTARLWRWMRMASSISAGRRWSRSHDGTRRSSTRGAPTRADVPAVRAAVAGLRVIGNASSRAPPGPGTAAESTGDSAIRQVNRRDRRPRRPRPPSVPTPACLTRTRESAAPSGCSDAGAAGIAESAIVA